MLVSGHHQIWLYTGVTDMRKQFDGLAALVSRQLEMSAQLGDWFCLLYTSPSPRD